MQAQKQHSITSDLAVSVISAAGEGQALWQHLSSQRQIIKQGPGLPDLDLISTRAAIRSTCSTLRDLTYPLITELPALVLGCDDQDGGADKDRQDKAPDQDEIQQKGSVACCRYTSDPAAWPPAQRAQQQQARAFLRRLTQLVNARVSVCLGGGPQMVQLLQEGSFTSSLKTLAIR